MKPRISTLILLATLAGSIVPSGPVQAQDEKRREFIEGLFRAIMEERHERHQHPPGQGPKKGRPVTPPPAQVSAEVKTFRLSITSYAQECDKLAAMLGRGAVQNPTLRTYLPDIYSIRSQSAVLHQNAGRIHDLSLVDTEFRALDVAWRDLAFRLKSDRSLDNQCRTCIKNIDGYGDQLCGLFGIQADFNRTEATLYAAQASAYTDSLLDVLQHELYDQPNCERLVKEGRQQMELARQFAANVTNYSLAESVESFEEWAGSWRTYGAKLHSFRNPRLARAVGRVRRCQNQLYDLMRIEQPIDYGYIDYLSAQCRNSCDDLFANLSIRTLGTLPRKELDVIFQLEKGLSPQFGTFCDQVSASSPQYDRVVKNFIVLEKNWTVCNAYLAHIAGDTASYRMTINNHVTEMRNLLQIAERLDMERTLSLAASVEGMANTLYAGLLRRARYVPSRTARNQSVTASEHFVKSAQAFHALVADGADYETLQRGCGALVDSWQKCSGAIQGLPKAGMNRTHYDSLSRVRSQIDPSMAELAVVLAP